MKAQGFEVKKNVLYQDNQSTILLLKHGKKSSGQRTRAVNIRYFYLTDLIENEDLSVEWKSTDNMKADYNSKPKQGLAFRKFRDDLMGIRKLQEDS